MQTFVALRRTAMGRSPRLGRSTSHPQICSWSKLYRRWKKTGPNAFATF